MTAKSDSARPPRRSGAGRERAATTRAGDARSAATPRYTLLAPAAWVVALSLIAADTVRIGFFGDDFHMLDAARRFPFLELLDGRHGIYPWYRPLSRELYFELVAHAGAFDRVLARVLSLAALALAAWQLRRIAARIGAPREGTIAALLLLCHATTRFLAGWSSGFQDLLALALGLAAVHEQLRGRIAAAVAWAAVGTFAKETAVLIFPLLAAHTLLFTDRPGRVSAWLKQLAGLAAAAIVHAAVRLTWQTGGREAVIERSWSQLAMALARTAGGFLPSGSSLESLAILPGLMAAAVALVLLGPFNAPRGPGPHAAPDVPERAAWRWFVPLGFVLGSMPLVVGHVAGVATASAYYAFTAVPWLALLLARAITRLPRAAATALVSLLVGADTMTLGFRVPDLSSAQAWEFKDWDWPEALRLSAISERLTGDLRSTLAARPDSTVVLYAELPRGCFFQSGDGPATRESLRDPSVRSYWLNAAPFGLEPGRLAILRLDPGSRHLRRTSYALDMRGKLAASSVAAGDAGAAWVYTQLGTPEENATIDLAYYRFAAALIAEGPERARRQLVVEGLADPTEANLENWATLTVGPSGPLHAAMVRVLSQPFEAQAHVALADACRDAHGTILEGVELRMAVVLDPRAVDTRLRLARLLLDRGEPDAARRELTRLARGFPGTEAARAAATLLESANHAGAPSTTDP